MNQQGSTRAVIVCGLHAGRTMSYGNTNKSIVYDVERNFEKFIASGGSADTVFFNKKKGNCPGRQPRQAHHQGHRQVPPPPSAGDEQFQNKYEKIVSKDALT
jgi:hypothetical protein